MSGSESADSNRSLNAEDLVIVIAIVITLLLSPLLAALWFLEKPILIPPPIISIFLGIAVSALLYRFLGGVHNASFTVGALKVTGTAAILIGVAYWSNGQLEKYLPQKTPEYPHFDFEKDVSPDASGWYAVDLDTGKPVSINFRGHDQQHPAPAQNELDTLRQNRNLGLKMVDDQLLVYAKDSQHIVGLLAQQELNAQGYHNSDDIELRPYRVETFASVQESDINRNLPFTVATNGFSEDYTRFILKSKQDGSTLLEDAILRRGAKIFKYQQKYYLISVVQVNHAPESIEPYAKIYIAEIMINH